MPTPFKLRSGNTTPFKLMGSSPVRQKATLFQKLRAATKVIGAQLIKPKLKIGDIGKRYKKQKKKVVTSDMDKYRKDAVAVYRKTQEYKQRHQDARMFKIGAEDSRLVYPGTKANEHAMKYFDEWYKANPSIGRKHHLGYDKKVSEAVAAHDKFYWESPGLKGIELKKGNK